MLCVWLGLRKAPYFPEHFNICEVSSFYLIINAFASWELSDMISWFAPEQPRYSCFYRHRPLLWPRSSVGYVITTGHIFRTSFHSFWDPCNINYIFLTLSTCQNISSFVFLTLIGLIGLWSVFQIDVKHATVKWALFDAEEIRQRQWNGCL